jgi:hypothetical protein
MCLQIVQPVLLHCGIAERSPSRRQWEVSPGGPPPSVLSGGVIDRAHANGRTGSEAASPEALECAGAGTADQGAGAQRADEEGVLRAAGN